MGSIEPFERETNAKTRVTAMAYHKPPLIDTPGRPRPQGKHDDKDDMWSPYSS